ncbi:MAG: hypothetical protein AAF939_21620 [Planctomycetota bacterium]
MKHIRNALDTLSIFQEQEENEYCAQLEKHCYEVWQQLFVVFLVEAARIRLLHDTQNPKGLAVKSVLARSSAWADHEIKRWRHWAHSMRFVKFATPELAKGFNISESIFDKVEAVKVDSTSQPSLTAATIALAMDESNEAFVERAWRLRREKPKPRS